MNTKQPPKSFDEVSMTFIALIFISIILSISIALMADISPSSGHGGFIYIIIPGLIGLLSLLVYVVLIAIKPRFKYIFGIAFILANLIAGYVMMNSTF
ncbi:hypothetical protein [Poritiphilus flavus]|uniref:Uncharacterized protein n=1 Tax=Poritiphilus flavus TaxID=2697053 RepID=A0A6L9EGN9_9FLAO|nr:hypothetical protein [Poritiphilus flavus]NAS13688.1 hypothetical protein [Poritiphilus flavus]